MKRKVCESLFAVTLALIVAVTNIPVTAFATEINQSARQEQTTESVQTENQGQQSDGLQENHEAQNETNSENGQNSTDNPAGAGQNSGEGENPAGTDLKKDNLFEGNNFQKADSANAVCVFFRAFVCTHSICSCIESQNIIKLFMSSHCQKPHFHM